MITLDEKTFCITPDSKPGAKGTISIDDLIAPTIRELNLKGYITHFSCEGHPYAGIENILFPDERSFEAYGSGNVSSIDVQPSGRLSVKYLLSPIQNSDLVITFDHAVDLPCIPQGFVFKYRRLKYYYPFYDNVFDFYEEKVRVARVLYEWALSLPANPLEGSRDAE